MSAVDQVIEAWAHAGWSVVLQQNVHASSPNPTRVDLARRKQRLAVLLYAWRITGEGKGRAGTDYRIQTTRSHPDDLLIEPDRLTLGFGIDIDRGVMAVFDGWTKRATGRSSSVHIDRGTLEVAEREGYAESGYPWDGRAATRLSEPDNLLRWIRNQTSTRTAAVQPVDLRYADDGATVVADLWNAPTASWLRPGDHLVLAAPDGRTLLDTALWAVSSVSVEVTNPGARYTRRRAIFVCTRAGRVQRNQSSLLRGLSGRDSP